MVVFKRKLPDSTYGGAQTNQITVKKPRYLVRVFKLCLAPRMNVFNG